MLVAEPSKERQLLSCSSCLALCCWLIARGKLSARCVCFPFEKHKTKGPRSLVNLYLASYSWSNDSHIVTQAEDKHKVAGECLEARGTEMPLRQKVPMLHCDKESFPMKNQKTTLRGRGASTAHAISWASLTQPKCQLYRGVETRLSGAYWLPD